MFFIAGGPGQAASAVAHHVLPGLARTRRTRDLIFVDLRGTGRSGALACQAGGGDLRTLFAAEIPVAELRACLTGYAADVRQYTTAHVVEDLEAVRRALGAPQVNVVGVSYGTRVALSWMRAHPRALRAAVLDSVAPPQMMLFGPFARDAQRAWTLLVRDCHADTDCRARFPGLPRALTAVLDELEARPRTVTVDHPVTGLPAQVSLTRAGVAMAVRGLLYSADLAALLPLALDQALAGDWRPLVAQTLALSEGAEDTTSLGLMLSTVCAEDVPRLSSPAGEDDDTFLGSAAVRWARSACAVWTHATVGPEVRAPVRSDVPTLLLSGEADPVTPPRWATLAAKTLSRHRHLVFTGQGHSVGRLGCAPRAVADFLASADPSAVRCARETTRPAFFLSPTGPKP